VKTLDIQDNNLKPAVGTNLRILNNTWDAWSFFNWINAGGPVQSAIYQFATILFSVMILC